MVSVKILIFSLFVGCFYHKGPALTIMLHSVVGIRIETSTKMYTPF